MNKHTLLIIFVGISFNFFCATAGTQGILLSKPSSDSEVIKKTIIAALNSQGFSVKGNNELFIESNMKDVTSLFQYRGWTIVVRIRQDALVLQPFSYTKDQYGLHDAVTNASEMAITNKVAQYIISSLKYKPSNFKWIKINVKK